MSNDLIFNALQQKEEVYFTITLSPTLAKEFKESYLLHPVTIKEMFFGYFESGDTIYLENRNLPINDDTINFIMWIRNHDGRNYHMIIINQGTKEFFEEGTFGLQNLSEDPFHLELSIHTLAFSINDSNKYHSI